MQSVPERLSQTAILCAHCPCARIAARGTILVRTLTTVRTSVLLIAPYSYGTTLRNLPIKKLRHEFGRNALTKKMAFFEILIPVQVPLKKANSLQR